MSKTVVNVEDILAAHEVIAAFNRLDLREVELRRSGQPIAVTGKQLEDFRFTGLNNRDFILMDLYADPDFLQNAEKPDA